MQTKEKSNESTNQIQHELGFGWWKFSGWATLIIGTIYLATVGLSEYKVIGFILLILNIWLGIAILTLSRWAFLIGTIASLNPILWIINGIYLKNRWNHPKVAGTDNSPLSSYSSAPTGETVKKPHIEEEALYEIAMREVQSDQRRPGLWSMCFAQMNGNESAATAQYISKRVAELKKQ